MKRKLSMMVVLFWIVLGVSIKANAWNSYSWNEQMYQRYSGSNSSCYSSCCCNCCDCCRSGLVRRYKQPTRVIETPGHWEERWKIERRWVPGRRIRVPY